MRLVSRGDDELKRGNGCDKGTTKVREPFSLHQGGSRCCSHDVACNKHSPMGLGI